MLDPFLPVWYTGQGETFHADAECRTLQRSYVAEEQEARELPWQAGVPFGEMFGRASPLLRRAPKRHTFGRPRQSRLGSMVASGRPPCQWCATHLTTNPDAVGVTA